MFETSLQENESILVQMKTEIIMKIWYIILKALTNSGTDKYY